MNGTDAGADLVGLLARRIDLLERLEDDPAGKDALVDDLDVSRSTVNRALRELEGRGFVTRAGGEFTASTSGRLAAERYREFLSSLETVVAAGPLLEAVPPSAAMDHAVLRGADVLVSEPPTPYRPLDRVAELVSDADEFLCLSAAVTRPRLVDRIADAILDGGARTEAVLAEPVAEFLREHRADALREATATDRFDAYVRRDLPYGLGVVRGSDGDHAFLVAYGPDGELRGVVANDAAAAVEWAEGVFRRHREAASELSVE